MAPIRPSSVLPGLVFLSSIRLPYFLPKKYAAESANDTANTISNNNFGYVCEINPPEIYDGIIIK